MTFFLHRFYIPRTIVPSPVMGGEGDPRSPSGRADGRRDRGHNPSGHVRGRNPSRHEAGRRQVVEGPIFRIDSVRNPSL